MSDPLTLPPCRICTGIATGIHYGINTCEACKAFFRRASMEKDKYQCTADYNCVITDRRRGNCSACRLKKWFDLGMSKGAVRHGRYTIAIRTKTIMEVKRLEGKDAVSSSDHDQALGIKSKKSSSGSDDSDSVTSTSQPTKLLSSPTAEKRRRKKRKSKRLKENQFHVEGPVVSDFTVNSTVLDDQTLGEAEMQEIVNLLVTAQEKIYPNLINYFNKDFNEKLQNDYFDSYTLRKEMFGLKTGTISTEEHRRLYNMTGIDIDDRLAKLEKTAGHIQRSIIKYITFAKVIPGFTNLSDTDKLSLIKASRFEYWILGHYLHMNPDLGVNVGVEIKFHREESIHYWGSEDIVNSQEQFARIMHKLALSYEEIAVLRAIVIVFRDRCPLDDPDQVERIQWPLIQCLKYVIQKVHPGDHRRFHTYISKLVDLRTLTEINRKSNKMLDEFQATICKNYPLVYECLCNI
ncbi:retinoic acid receptor alpha-like [Pecten maximus]|uniref:retinoic acid receptor alpha-like n=1 Tax=Pecten maximus TaxID=6579 RepID=UPI0014589EDC|nr:retinoic acid receptor alpha-like [Pecten maximus]XP_033751543.1 retinoic acid receptor alpha-like [Pecten maximus]